MLDYHKIAGWCDFDDLYQKAIDRAKPGAVFVEIGAWLGRSTASMGRRIKDSKKNMALLQSVWVLSGGF
jgi:hypothetical protein